ncbi:MAG: glucuronate isomerase [Oscillospiraceae bacterium]|nr:glucuronate isomerase [Oscillospiraceae bacterium]
MDKDFLLETKTAKKLYFEYAADMPIIDYHCHINPAEIAQNRKFDNITQAWLGGDHYKWRMIRSNGVPEEEITGDADDRIKFQRFAEALPLAIGNPMYHWTHLELQRYFNFNKPLSAKTADEAWEVCNAKLQSEDMRVRSIIEKSNVKVIGTTDDPCDSLEWHKALKDEEGFDCKVVPSFRPDKMVNIDKDGFAEYIQKFSEVCGKNIESLADLLSETEKRIDLFHEMGCRASDHGLDYAVCTPATTKEADEIFKAALSGKAISVEQAEKYKTVLLLFFGAQYARRGWVMQIHYNVLRNTNAKMFKKLGPDTGFDTISKKECSAALAKFLDTLNTSDSLPKTIIYSLDPNDNEFIGTVIGAFQGTEAAGKIQHGSAWWFNDTKTGMQKQLTDLANLSVLGNFVGMLTDSRSFLSYTRHEYFRRILCNLLGNWVENGEYPNDPELLEQIVKGICFNNANAYFGFNCK